MDFEDFLIIGGAITVVILACIGGVSLITNDDAVVPPPPQTTMQERVVKLESYGNTNVTREKGGYIHYTIEGGAARCREHYVRAETACWNTGRVSFTGEINFGLGSEEQEVTTVP